MIRVVTVLLFLSRVTAASALDVSIYDWANTSRSVLAEAHRVLASIFRAGGIELRWQVRPPSSPEASRVVFTEPARPGREQELRCAARRDIALLIVGDSAVAPTRTCLGSANPFAPEGINVTIFYPRVLKTAHEHRIPPATLLAHAIAHEVGHVLLRANGHRKHGLMAGGWDEAQFQWIRRSGMFFERVDAERMKASIAGEGCGNPGAPATARRD